jgi:hypothetical protein
LLQGRLNETAKQRPETYQAAAPLPGYADTIVTQIRDLHRRLLGQVQLA